MRNFKYTITALYDHNDLIFFSIKNALFKPQVSQLGTSFNYYLDFSYLKSIKNIMESLFYLYYCKFIIDIINITFIIFF